MTQPRIEGAQFTLVAGPEGEETHPDECRRIKLWFPWDRRAKKDGSDTCWVRVSQNWAGAGWGGQVSYQSRFGSLLRAYKLVGFTPDRDYRYIEINKRLCKIHARIIHEKVDRIDQIGGHVQRDTKTGLLTINHEFSTSLVIARCTQTGAGAYRLNIQLDAGLLPDITVVLRMNQANETPLDYYLLPTVDMTRYKLRLPESNGLSLNAYRFDDLTRFVAMSERTSILEVT